MSWIRRYRILVAAILCGLTAGSGVLGESFGTSTRWTMIPAAAFRPESSADGVVWSDGTLTPSNDVTTVVVAPLFLPNGAFLLDIRVLVVDVDPTSDIVASLWKFGQEVAGTQTCSRFFWDRTSAGILGRGEMVLSNANVPVTVRTQEVCNSADSYIQYYLRVRMGSRQHGVSGAIVEWQHPISAAPAVSTFDDVPVTDPYFRAIESLAASGVTSGCGQGNFCPNDVVTRAQAAKFLANALGLHSPQ